MKRLMVYFFIVVALVSIGMHPANATFLSGKTPPRVVTTDGKTITTIKTKTPKRQKPITIPQPKTTCSWSLSLTSRYDMGTEFGLNSIGGWDTQKSEDNLPSGYPLDALGYQYWKVTCPNKPAKIVRILEDKRNPKNRDVYQNVEAVAKSITSVMDLPQPTPGMALMSLPADRVGTLPVGTPYVLVNGAYWYWTDPETYTSRTDFTELDNVWARVTATAVALEFTPRQGGTPVSCQGPGQPQTLSLQSLGPAPSHGCYYRYQQTTARDPGQMLTATLSIRWRITWVGANNTGGELPSTTTSVLLRYAVVEAQTVVTR